MTTTTIDQVRVRRVRALAQSNDYRLSKSNARTAAWAGTFGLYSSVDRGFSIHGITLEQAERWVQVVPAADASRLHWALHDSQRRWEARVAHGWESGHDKPPQLDVDAIIADYEQGRDDSPMRRYVRKRRDREDVDQPAGLSQAEKDDKVARSLARNFGPESARRLASSILAEADRLDAEGWAEDWDGLPFTRL